MNALITICARGGSKGIPRKNIKLLAGKPLIAYSIAVAEELKSRLDLHVDIELSTDSMEIRKVAANYGLTTKYHRPERLATDTSGKIEVIKDLLRYSQNTNQVTYDYVIDLDVSSPLRKVSDIEKSLKLLQSDPEALNIFSVNPADKNPYFNMVEKKKNGYFSEVKKLDSSLLSRQAAPKVFEMNASFYIYTKKFFELGINSAVTNKSLIFEMKHICFDLDELLDFEYMNFLLENNKLDFKLLK